MGLVICNLKGKLKKYRIVVVKYLSVLYIGHKNKRISETNVITNLYLGVIFFRSELDSFTAYTMQ